MNDMNKLIAVCPGSYDPITNGHLDVIARAAALYDEVVIAVVNRSVRKDKTLFPIEERLAFIEHATAGMPGVRAEPFNTLVVEFARKVGAWRSSRGCGRSRTSSTSWRCTSSIAGRTPISSLST